MKGMNLQEQKKCGILLTVIGLVMFAIGFLLGDAHMGDFYSGLGCGLFVCGAVRLLRVYRLSRDPEKAADYDAMLKDERTIYVANKARSMTFFICVYAQLAAGLLALCGGLLSLGVMWALYHLPHRPTWFILSVCGAVAHNLGQLAGASVVLSSRLALGYAPVLLVSGLAMGGVTAASLSALLPALEKMGYRGR